MVVNTTVGMNDRTDWVSVEREKRVGPGWSPGKLHTGAQQDVRVCYLP